MVTVITDKDIGEGLRIENKKVTSRILFDPKNLILTFKSDNGKNTNVDLKKYVDKTTLNSYLKKSDENNVLNLVGMNPNGNPIQIDGEEALNTAVYAGNYALTPSAMGSDSIPFATGDGGLFVFGIPLKLGEANNAFGDVKQFAWNNKDNFYFRGADGTDGEGTPDWGEWHRSITDRMLRETDDGALKYASPIIEVEGKNATFEKFGEYSPKFKYKGTGVYEFTSPVSLRSDGSWVIDVPYKGGITPIVDYDLNEVKIADNIYKITLKTYKQKLVQELDSDGYGDKAETR